MNEADTCREYVVPNLIESGWDNAPHSIAEQRIVTDGRVFLVRGKAKRGKQKKADYLLRYTRDFPIAVVEAKADYKKPGDGLSQAKDYAQTLDLKFAYSTNGTGIIEFDFLTGTEKVLTQFPSPLDLWNRLAQASNLTDRQQEQLLEGFNLQSGKVPNNFDGWLMTGHLFRVRFDQKSCLPAYAFAVLRGSRNARDQIFGQIRGATRPGFNTPLLSRVEIPLLSIDRQTKSIARLQRLSASLEQVRTLHKRTSAEFDALLPSLLDRAFEGDL